jgi:hypothetical protein
MRHIKEYHRLFENTQELAREQKNWLNKCTDGTWGINPQNGLIDVYGDFECKEQELTDFKGVRFGKVTLSFNCSDNSLTSLAGAPQSVGKFFNCSDNSLTSLEGAPQEVGASFDCSDNSLTSLKGLPNEFILSGSGSFYCSSNFLTSLEGLPDVFRVYGNFNCSYNQLISLKGSPQTVGGNFNCSHNHLTSLEGAPQRVDRIFDCSDNSLTSLEGSPQEVGGDLDCDGNPISGDVIMNVIRAMSGKKISLEQAVADVWRRISKEGDKVYLAKHNPDLSPEEKKGYEALERHKRRII